MHTVDGESFTGLNFRGFRSFLEDHKSFSMNTLLYVLKISALALNCERITVKIDTVKI